MKSILRSLPFVRHQPPISIPIRKAIVLALLRPVEIKQIEKFLSKKLEKNIDEAIANIEYGIKYLRRERLFKRDASNLFVASLRAICEINPELGIEFGNKYIPLFHDNRAIRTQVTYLMRMKMYNEALSILAYSKNRKYKKQITQKLLTILDIRKGDSDTNHIPWAFELENDCRLSKKSQIFKHRVDILDNQDGMAPEFELVGFVRMAKKATHSDALVSFLFFDENMEPVSGVKVEGLTFSNTVGWYSYLKQNNETGEFVINFELPENCVYIHTGFRIWHAKKTVDLLPNLEIRPSSLNRFEIDFQRFLSNSEVAKSDELVFMFSGTTYVQDVRANRPIRLTKELLKRDIPVIFNYHRWRRTDEHPEYQGDLLFQIPIDVTKQFMSRLASIKSRKKKIFIVSYPHTIIPKILNRFKVNGWVNIYDARDDWEEFEKVGQAKWYKSSNEKYIVRNCDHVTAVSKPLAEKLNQYEPHKNVKVVPNALSPNFLSQNYRWKGSAKNNKVGYFGHLTSSWFDWDSLIQIANARPEYSFEIIGHSAPDDLELPSNINLMGPKTHPEINEIAAEWNVAIIPFKTGPLADAVDPIKIYEYMALDLPTVSFTMPQIDDYPSTLTVESVDEFCFALDEYIRYRPKKGSLNKWLETNQWSNRVDDFINLSSEKRDDGISYLGED